MQSSEEEEEGEEEEGVLPAFLIHSVHLWLEL